MPTHTNSWSNAAPADADDINQGAAEMRKFRLDVDERMDVDHDWPASTDGGYHTAVHLKEQGADPTNVANVGIVYTKDDAGDTELYYEDDSGNVVKITEDGVLATTMTTTVAAKQREEITRNAGGFWGDVYYKDADEINIKVKSVHGMTPWVGVILNNGKYLELTSDFNLVLGQPGAGGHILDGITATLNNEWYIIWGYETAGGALSFGYTWMPCTTFSTNNPTDTLALNQVNTQDIGLLFNPGANLLVWNASTKFETWRYNTAGGSTPTGECYVDIRVATMLMLDGALAVNNFSANDYVIQLDNFKPLAVDDGLVVDVIGSRGYRDTGIRVRTGAAGAIMQFSIHGKRFYFTNGDGSVDYARASGLNTYTVGNTYTTTRESHVPPDKTGIIRINMGFVSVVAKHYYDTYGVECAAGDDTVVFHENSLVEHGLSCYKCGVAATTAISTMGYML